MTSTPPTNTPPTASPKTPGSIGSEKNCFSFALQQPRTPLSGGADSLLPPGEKRTYSGTSFHRASSAANSSSNNSSMNSGNNAVNPFVPSMNINTNGGGSNSSTSSSIHSIHAAAAHSTTSGTSTGVGSMNSNTFGSAMNNNNNNNNIQNNTSSNPSSSSSNERGSSQLFGNLTAITTNPSLHSGNNNGNSGSQQQQQPLQQLQGGARTSNQSNRTDNDTYGSANSIQHLDLGSGGSITPASQSANRSPTPSAFGACLSAGRSPADRGMSFYSLQNNANRPHEFDTRPVITVKALARFVYDSWLNGPFKKLYFPDLYKRNVPLEGKNLSKQSLKLLFQNSCWLSYVLHHSIVQAVCQGYNVHVDKNNRVVKCWVFDGEKVNLGEVPHSWNVFQTESILLSAEEAHVLHLNEQQNNGRRTHSRNFSAGSAGSSAATRYLELEEESARTNSIFCCDLTIDQFDDNQKVPETVDVPAYKVVKGPARLRADVFKTATESKHWIGKEVVLDHHHEKDLFARQDLWQYFVMLLLAYSARNFPFADTFFTPPPGALQPPEQVPSGVSSRHHRRASSNSAYSPSLTPNSVGAHGNDTWPHSGRSTPGDNGDLLSANGNTKNNRRGSFHRSPLATSALLPPKESEQRENVEAKMEDAFKFYMQQLQMQQMYEMIKSSDLKYTEQHQDSLCSTLRSADLQEQQRRILPRVFGNSQKSENTTSNRSSSNLDTSPNASTTPTLRPTQSSSGNNQQLGNNLINNTNISAPSRSTTKQVSATNNNSTTASSKSTSSNGSDLMPAPSTNSQQQQAPPAVLAQMQHQHQPKSHMLPNNNQSMMNNNNNNGNIHQRGGGGAMQQLHQHQVHQATSQFVQQQQPPMMQQQLMMQQQQHQHPPTQLVMAQTHSATMVPQSNAHANLLMATAAGQHPQLAQQQHHPLVGPHPHPHPQQPQQVLHSNPNAGLTQMTMMMPQQVMQQQMLPQLLVTPQQQLTSAPNMLMNPQLQMQQQQMLLQQQQQQQQQQHLMQMQLQQQQLQQQQQHQAAVAQQSQMLAMSSSGGAAAAIVAPPNPLMSTLPPPQQQQQQLVQAIVPAPMTQMHLQQPMQTQMLAMTAPLTPLQQQQQAVAAQQLLLQQQQHLLQMQQQRLAELQKQQQQVIASQQLAMAQQAQLAQAQQQQHQHQQQQQLSASATSSSSGSSFNTVASPGSALSGTSTTAAGLGQSNTNSASASSSTSSHQKINNNNNNNNNDTDAINKMANFEIPEPPFELASSPKYQKDIMQIQREVQHFIRACILCGGDEALRRKQVLFSFMLTRFLHTKELLKIQTDTPRNQESV